MMQELNNDIVVIIKNQDQLTQINSIIGTNVVIGTRGEFRILRSNSGYMPFNDKGREYYNDKQIVKYKDILIIGQKIRCNLVEEKEFGELYYQGKLNNKYYASFKQDSFTLYEVENMKPINKINITQDELIEHYCKTVNVDYDDVVVVN